MLYLGRAERILGLLYIFLETPCKLLEMHVTVLYMRLYLLFKNIIIILKNKWSVSDKQKL